MDKQDDVFMKFVANRGLFKILLRIIVISLALNVIRLLCVRVEIGNEVIVSEMEIMIWLTMTWIASYWLVNVNKL